MNDNAIWDTERTTPLPIDPDETLVGTPCSDWDATRDLVRDVEPTCWHVQDRDRTGALIGGAA